MFTESIDRRSYVPYYVQLRDALISQIEEEHLQPGDQLPGEPELCRLFNVSRTVVRQALGELEWRGLIVREKGKGTFVARPKIEEGLFQQLTGFHQDMVHRGYSPVSRILKQEAVNAGEKVASFLKLPAGTPVIQIDRLRFVQDEPIVLVTTYIPYILCPELLETDLSHRSLYEFLEKECNIRMASGERVIEAVAAGEHEAELLAVRKGAPLILVESVTYLEDGTPLEYYHALHRGDRSRFEVKLIRMNQREDQLTELLSQD